MPTLGPSGDGSLAMCDGLATLAGGHAADDLGPVVAVAEAVELALAPGEALDDDLGVGVDEDRHLSRPLLRSPATQAVCGRSLAGARSLASRAALTTVGDANGLPGRLEHRRLADELGRRDPGVEDDLATLLSVRAVEADDDRRPQLDPAEALDDALGHLLAARDAAEDVDED